MESKHKFSELDNNFTQKGRKFYIKPNKKTIKKYEWTDLLNDQIDLFHSVLFVAIKY